ncbi:hypothetical protein KEJ51_05935 [Candidatus Bathyarchaeota archaeon]|nr:hypothetical protein [Candidatus Bathyarchaeota archaeon]MBS7629248.1 hypothetical protein [Candidatus Bathyarchaeota archaeon]
MVSGTSKVGGVPLLHILFFINGILMIATMYTFTGFIASTLGRQIAEFATALYFILGVLSLAAGWGIFKRTRKVMVAVAVLGLLAVPIATILSIFILWILLKPEAKRTFT